MFHRAAAVVYTLLVVELLVLVTVVPGLVVLVLLDRHPGNLPLVALCALPLGPALSAAVFAIRHRADLTPFHTFWRGYRLNARGVLALWVPWLAWMTVLAVNLAFLRAAGVPGWFAPLLVVLAVIGALWMANALAITSLFAFRARDVARLAGYYLVRKPGVTVGAASLLVVAAGVTFASSEAVLALLASLLAAALIVTARPMLTEIEDRFTP